MRVFRKLEADKVVQTCERIKTKINKMFPDSSLADLADELIELTKEAEQTNKELKKSQRPLKLVAIGILLLIVSTLALWLLSLGIDFKINNIAELAQGLDAAKNDAICVALAAYFIMRWESRWKLKKVRRKVHGLRIVAHIIDMHQINKDPECPKLTVDDTYRTLNHYELKKYLWYCRELFGIISKIGALYVQEFEEQEARDAVNSLEELTNGLSLKADRKMTIVEQLKHQNKGNKEDKEQGRKKMHRLIKRKSYIKANSQARKQYT